MRKALFAEEQMVRSSARRIASRWRWWPSGTGSARRKRFGGFQANDIKTPEAARD